MEIKISNETVIIYGDIKIEKNYSEEDLNNLIKIYIQQIL